MDEQIINRAAGLIILMAVNIAHGALGSLFVHRFNWRRFLQGVAKGIIIIICFIASYFAGYLNPDIVAVNIGGIEASVMTALNLVILMQLNELHYTTKYLLRFYTKSVIMDTLN